MKIVQVTLSRQYYKEVTISVEVEDTLIGEELQDFLTTDIDVDNRLEEALSESSLFGGDDEYTYYDETDKNGGHL